MLLNFKSKWLTYISSWRQSVENYWKIRDAYNDKITIVYYEKVCSDFANESQKLFRFLDIPFQIPSLHGIN